MSSTSVDCTGLQAPDVLAHLYNHAKPLGMGFFAAKASPMTSPEAWSHLQGTKYFDYLNGRPMKLNFAKFPILEPRLYDRDQGGTGTLANLVAELKKTGKVSKAVKFTEKNKGELKEILQTSNASI